ncbi:hypothetical protein JOM56_002159 [Amanita muscaria]
MLAPVLRRRYATTSQSNPNNILLVIAGAAAAAGAYYYLRGRPVDDALAKVERDEEVMAHKARELLEAGKVRVADARKQAEQKLDEKTAGDDKVAAGKARLKSAEESVERTLQDAESRMNELGSEAKAKAGRMYEETKATAEQKVGEARGALESKGEEVKRGWFSWLGWGKSKGQVARDRVEQGKD